MVLSRARVGSIRPLRTGFLTRDAHAQAQPAQGEEEQQAGPSNYYRRSSDTRGHGKGKAKEQGQGQETEYRFPAKGKMGGEPDPFEVMSIERSASQSEVKKQCTSNHLYKAHDSCLTSHTDRQTTAWLYSFIRTLLTLLPRRNISQLSTELIRSSRTLPSGIHTFKQDTAGPLLPPPTLPPLGMKIECEQK
jgi:hypothetical protein